MLCLKITVFMPFLFIVLSHTSFSMDDLGASSSTQPLDKASSSRQPNDDEDCRIKLAAGNHLLQLPTKINNMKQ